MKTITEAEYMAALNDFQGWCTTCEAISGESCEPDAENYHCDVCDNNTVRGMEMAIIEELFMLEPEV